MSNLDPESSSEGPGVSRRTFLVGSATLAALGLGGRARAGEEKAKEKSMSESTEPENLEELEELEGEAEQEAEGISEETIEEAEKLFALRFEPEERTMMLRGLRRAAARYPRRREMDLPNGVGPAHVFDPRPAEVQQRPTGNTVTTIRRSPGEAGRLPSSDDDIAFAPVTRLARWIESRQLTSTRLTEIYLERLKRFGEKLECVVTITEDLARRQARKADEEIAAGKYRGPLHGIPWGAKDLLDTAGIRTTWGATPYRERVPDSDATVVKMLADAGAVLIAKTTLGALAYGDIWFGGTTRNPFNLEQGSSGSSAGSASGTAAGLMGFSIGTETLGSIVSPSMRCGTTGLRPTFGRVSRAGAMALCWSLDKIGPICRTVEDSALVLAAIHGADPGDPASLDVSLEFDATRDVRGLRVGYVPGWFEGRRATDIDRSLLDVARKIGLELVEIDFPRWNYNTLMTILNVEAAAAFEELTLTNRDDELKWQAPQAWPNSFRQTWFTPAIELVQAQRFRTQVCAMMQEKFEGLDAMIGPSYAGSMLLITNHTGHPSLTLRAGFRSNDQPHGVTVWGKLFDEGTICSVGLALEREFDVWDRRPAL